MGPAGRLSNQRDGFRTSMRRGKLQLSANKATKVQTRFQNVEREKSQRVYMVTNNDTVKCACLVRHPLRHSVKVHQQTHMTKDFPGNISQAVATRKSSTADFTNRRKLCFASCKRRSSKCIIRHVRNGKLDELEERGNRVSDYTMGNLKPFKPLKTVK